MSAINASTILAINSATVSWSFAERKWMIVCEIFLPNGKLITRQITPSAIIIQNRIWLISMVEEILQVAKRRVLCFLGLLTNERSNKKIGL